MDYFDIDEVLARRNASDGSTVARALDATFKRSWHGAPRLAPGLPDAFANDPAKRARWTAFTKNLRLAADESISLEEAVTRIGQFLLPVVKALLTGKIWNRSWLAGGPWTERG